MHGATTAEIPLRYMPHICYVDGISAVLKIPTSAENRLLHGIIIAGAAERLPSKQNLAFTTAEFSSAHDAEIG